MELADLLTPGAIRVCNAVKSKKRLFQDLAEIASSAHGIDEAIAIDALQERESLGPTGVGHGVALPHATINDAKRAYVGVFTTDKPVDYLGPDDQPVDVFFVTICPPSERQTHLQLLSRIAALSLKTNLLERLREAEDPEAMRRAIEECSTQIEA